MRVSTWAAVAVAAAVALPGAAHRASAQDITIGVSVSTTGPAAALGNELGQDKVTLSGGQATAALPNYEQHVAAVRNVAQQDPKRAAQVVKEWVASDGR